MFKKILIGLIVLVLACVFAVVFAMRQVGPEKMREADRYNIPVIEAAMNNLSNWDYNDLAPYLSKHFIKLLANDENLQNDLDEISFLGKVINYRTPRHVSHKSYDHWLYGKCAVNRYTVSAQFEKGRGSVNFKLNHCFERPKITFMQVASRSLPTKSPALE